MAKRKHHKRELIREQGSGMGWAFWLCALIAVGVLVAVGYAYTH